MTVSTLLDGPAAGDPGRPAHGRSADDRSSRAGVRELLVASRPFSWVNTALPFLAAGLGADGRMDAAVLVGLLYFLFPYNLLLYGVNDLYDYASDVANPRKGSIEGGLVPPAHARSLWIAVLATNLPLLVLLAWLAGPAAGACAGLAALTAWLYSAPPLRTKERPFLDSLTSALHFVLPAATGFLVAGTSPADLPWPMVLGFLCWGIASHALGAIQDIAYDRAAGIGSIATALDVRPTAIVALLGYAAAVLAAATYGPAGLFAAAWLALYLLLPVMVLARPDEAAARRAWRSFLGLNLLVGFVLAHVLLRWWGITDFSTAELLVTLAAGPAAFVLLSILATAWLTRRRPTSLAPAALGPQTIVVPCPDEPTRLPASGEAQRTQAVPSGWTGRTWVAWTGASAATTDWLLFVDADTVLEPDAARALVAIALEDGSDMVSGVPAFAMPTPTERALIPGLPMLLFGFLPLGLLALTRGRPARLAFACGSLLLVRRAAYLAVGGHAAVATSTREDVDLARAFVAAGRRVSIVHAANLATTRRYRSAGAVAAAWRRVLPAYSGGSLAIGVTALIGSFLAWGLPMLLPLVGLAAGDTTLVAGGLASLALMVAARLALAATQRQPPASLAWHPVTVTATLAFGVAGLIADILGRPRTSRGRIPPTRSPDGVPIPGGTS